LRRATRNADSTVSILTFLLNPTAEDRSFQLPEPALPVLYASEPSLHQRDGEAGGFQWTIADDRANSVFSFLRRTADRPHILVVCNMTPVPRHGYRIGSRLRSRTAR
jgi:1,4-alpha-glucan branching enzyme